jgi:hypothetical protein
MILAAETPKETTMFAKTLIAALVLAGTSLAFVADASAATKPAQAPGLSQFEQGWMDRASNPDTNGGN